MEYYKFWELEQKFHNVKILHVSPRISHYPLYYYYILEYSLHGNKIITFKLIFQLKIQNNNAYQKNQIQKLNTRIGAYGLFELLDPNFYSFQLLLEK